MEVLQAYLTWRQNECHLNYQHDTFLWQLINSGKSDREAEEVLKGSLKQDGNELLYQSFNINFEKDIPAIFRQGTCTLKRKVEEILKGRGDDCPPVKRHRRKVITVHSENIASKMFWNDQVCLVKELGQFTEDLNKPKTEYLESFQLDSRLMPSTWIVIRIDGCHFHRFSESHEFDKPNDAQALNLMNSCAVGVVEEFKDIAFAYGVSDEYSFVLKKESQLYERRSSEIVSAVVSFFSSMYTMKWREYFPFKEMKNPPYFDGRAVCYPSSEILRDYLSWRQVDCHINNQYNTCFWMLVKSGKSKSDAQKILKGTQAQKKNELVDEFFGVSDYYNTLPAMFRHGSSLFWEKEEKKIILNKEEGCSVNSRKIVVVKYCDIIDESFWESHEEILIEPEKRSTYGPVQTHPRNQIVEMASSIYEYVKLFEMEDEIMPPNIIVVRLEGRDFRRFSEVHEFEKPNDMKALGLMNECAKAVLEQFPDITFSYGYSDEYSFVFKTGTKFCQRRASTILSLVVSSFTFIYVTKWKELFLEKDLGFAPSFKSQVISCATLEVLQAYLAWRQNECHLNNQHDTCLWQLINSGKSKREAEELLTGSLKQDRNEMLYQSFNINYKKDIPAIFRQGTCTLERKVEEILKLRDDDCPPVRIITVHSENIASKRFWNDQICLVKELGQFTEDLNKPKTEYLEYFQFDTRLMPSTWIVICIDGCHFHRFSESHEFEKPSDAQALNLMKSCAAGVLEEFKDIVYAYGFSEEYSFVLKKESQLYEMRSSEIVSALVSFFSSMYSMKWKEYFPDQAMKHPPYFKGRAVCYPSYESLREYLSWRQVDCHINNQFNTCFWMLVKSGKSKSDAQNILKGTQAETKIGDSDELSGVSDDYKTLRAMFRYGSSVFWEKEKKILNKEEGCTGKSRKIVVVKHCNIIDESFWESHEEILNEKLNCSRTRQACNSFISMCTKTS